MVLSLDKLNHRDDDHHHHHGVVTGGSSMELTDQHRLNRGSKSLGHPRMVQQQTQAKGQSSAEANNGVNANALSYYLFESAKAGTPDEMETLLADGANPNVIDSFGRSPLHVALLNECSCLVCVKDAESCVRLLLNSHAVNADLQDDTGNTPLHYAVSAQLSKCAEMLISYGVDVTIKNDAGEDAIRLMAKKLPNGLVYLLDESIYVDQYDPHHEKCLLKVDLRPVVGDLEDNESTRLPRSNKKSSLKSKLRKHSPSSLTKELTVLSQIVEISKEERRSILTHPVVKTFLHLKWQKTRSLFWGAFMAYVAWVLLLTEFIVHVYLISCPCRHFVRNSTSSNESMQAGSAEACEIATGLGIEVSLIIFATLLMIIWEIGKLCVTPKMYLRSWLNYGTWGLIFLVLSTTIPTIFGQASINPHQYQAAAFTVFVAWAYMIPQVGRLPALSKYVEIFGHVLQCFGLFFMTFASLFIGFAISFSILFPGNDSPYGNGSMYYLSVLKVLIMVVGELDYQEMFYGDSKVVTENGPILGHLMYAAFAIVICVILMNLFIGLTVSDIQALEREAEFARVCRLILSFHHLDSFLSSRRLPPAISKHLQKRFAVCSSYHHHQNQHDSSTTPGAQFTFAFYPNDPSDSSLPEGIKRESVLLAEASFSKSRSQRCTKLPLAHLTRSFGEKDGSCQTHAMNDVPSYFSSPTGASTSSSTSSSPLETHSLDVAALSTTRHDGLVPRPSWTSCASQR